MLIPVEDALKHVLSRVSVTKETINLDLQHCLGYILAEDCYSVQPTPAFDNSAVDGYTIRVNDISTQGSWLEIIDTIEAGNTKQIKLPANKAIRIFTGAPIPVGADAVVMQEHVSVKYDNINNKHKVFIKKETTNEHNIRKQAAELMANTILYASGTKITAAIIGVLASQGITNVVVYKPLTVGVISTGDELVDPYTKPLMFGQVYNSNAYMLQALITTLGFKSTIYPIIRDNESSIVQSLCKIESEVDVIVASGGVSVGERDLLKNAIADLGVLELWRIAIQPGKPFAFGFIKNTPIFGLPGNPVASLLSFLILVRDFLYTMQGRRHFQSKIITGCADFNFAPANIRQQYLRAVFNNNVISIKQLQNSAALFTASNADGFAIVPIEKTINKGDYIDFISFNELLN